MTQFELAAQVSHMALHRASVEVVIGVLLSLQVSVAGLDGACYAVVAQLAAAVELFRTDRLVQLAEVDVLARKTDDMTHIVKGDLAARLTSCELASCSEISQRLQDR